MIGKYIVVAVVMLMAPVAHAAPTAPYEVIDTGNTYIDTGSLKGFDKKDAQFSLKVDDAKAISSDTTAYKPSTTAGADGALQVSSCMPPGPRTLFHNGKDGLPCQVTQGLADGQFVTGTCQGGYCRAVTFSSVLGAMGQQLTQSFLQQFLSGAFGGGSAYPGDTATYDYPTTTVPVDTPVIDDPTSWDFLWYDDETTTVTELTNDTVSTPTITYTNTDTEKPVTITQRLYAKPSTGNYGTVSDIPGDSDFQRELVGTTLNVDEESSQPRTLSLADLERAAADARLRESGVGNNADTEDLLDYRSSNISRTDEEYPEEEEKDLPWWVTFAEFVGSLLGVANSTE